MSPQIPSDPKNLHNLSRHGYRLSKSAPARHRALSKAARTVPVHQVLHELEALAIRMRDKDDPKSYESRAWDDYQWVESKHHIPKRR